MTQKAKKAAGHPTLRTVLAWFLVSFLSIFVAQLAEVQDAVVSDSWDTISKVLLSAIFAGFVGGIGGVLTHYKVVGDPGEKSE